MYIYKKAIDEISNDKNWKKKFDIYLNNRLKGKILYPTAKHAYLKKKITQSLGFLHHIHFQIQTTDGEK